MIHLALPHIKRVRWLRVLLAIFIFLAADVAIQLTLPSNRTSSNARLADINIVAMSESEFDETLGSIENSSYMYLRAGEEVYIRSLADLGIQIDRTRLRENANYTTREKLMPFSAVGRYFGSDLPIEYSYDETRTREFIEEIAPYSEVLAEPAGILPEGAAVGVQPDIPGERLDVEASVSAVLGQEFVNRIEIELVSVTYRDDFTTERALELAEEANLIIKEAPQLVGQEGNSITIPAEEMATWFDVDLGSSEPELVLLEDQLNDYLGGLTSSLREPATDSVVTLLDDREVTRVNGVSGQTIDRSLAAEQLKESLFAADAATEPIELQYVDVKPGVTYRRTYSDSDAGLSTFLRDTFGSVYAVSVIDLDSPSFRAGYNQNEVMTAASTYKMYVAYYVVNQIEEGKRSWSDKLPSGRQIDHCYSLMIERSSNSCAVELKDFFGGGNINSYVRSLGLSEVPFWSYAAKTTASDLTRSLQMLYDGRLMNAEHTDQLIALMKRQIHRKAIPAGVAPAQVADKGGFVNGYNHDTGIVYGSNGDYAVTIMTRYGQSKSDLANAARKIHNFMEDI
ncbi:MAG: serine hydrolase [Patescibacteria group bacterium]